MRYAHSCNLRGGLKGRNFPEQDYAEVAQFLRALMLASCWKFYRE